MIRQGYRTYLPRSAVYYLYSIRTQMKTLFSMLVWTPMAGPLALVVNGGDREFPQPHCRPLSYLVRHSGSGLPSSDPIMTRLHLYYHEIQAIGTTCANKPNLAYGLDS